MKTRNLALAAITLLTAASLAACGNDDDTDLQPSAVPSAVSTVFLAQYPTATNVEWEAQGKYYKADFNLKGGLVDVDAWYTQAGQWAMTQFDYGKNLLYLPNQVSAAFAKSQYANWTVDDIDEYKYPSASRNVFVIEVEAYGQPDTDLYFQLNGNTATLVRTAAHTDVNITPDTVLL